MPNSTTSPNVMTGACVSRSHTEFENSVRAKLFDPAALFAPVLYSDIDDFSTDDCAKQLVVGRNLIWRLEAGSVNALPSAPLRSSKPWCSAHLKEFLNADFEALEPTKFVTTKFGAITPAEFIREGQKRVCEGQPDQFSASDHIYLLRALYDLCYAFARPYTDMFTARQSHRTWDRHQFFPTEEVFTASMLAIRDLKLSYDLVWGKKYSDHAASIPPALREQYAELFADYSEVIRNTESPFVQTNFVGRSELYIWDQEHEEYQRCPDGEPFIEKIDFTLWLRSKTDGGVEMFWTVDPPSSFKTNSIKERANHAY
jgi:hypothetical protein